MSKILASQGEANVYNSYDIIGDVAIIRLRNKQGDGKRDAQALMGIHKNLKTVFVQTGAVCGDFRVRQLKYLAGERKTLTVHRESGCLFSVDVKKCFFSPRLSYERMRVAKQVRNGEVVVNMFAGVGCFSILIAKHSDARIYSIDVNPEAVNHMETNVRLNSVYGKVIPILGDAREVIEKRLLHSADRVIMPLPEKASEYLPCALSTLKNSGGWIHYYDFEHAPKDFEAAEKVGFKISEKFRTLGVNFQVLCNRIVRSIGPHWWQVAMDIRIGE